MEDQLNEEDAFKNKTLRFTNNNFVANNRKDSGSFMNIVGGTAFESYNQRNDASPIGQKEVDDPEDSIEEDIITSPNETP